MRRTLLGATSPHNLQAPPEQNIGTATVNLLALHVDGALVDALKLSAVTVPAPNLWRPDD